MPEQRVVVIADLGVDLLVRVPELPESDHKTTGEHVAKLPGGMGANAAGALGRLGCPVRLLARAGDDQNGSMVLEAMRAASVDVAHVVRMDGVATTLCVILITPDGEKSLVRVPTDAYHAAVEDLTDGAFEGCDHAHLTCGSTEVARRALGMAKEKGMTTSLDLESADIPDDADTLEQVLTNVDTLFVNRRARTEIEKRFGSSYLELPGELVTTLGVEGASYSDGTVEVEQPGFEVEPVDTTGAGDEFAAAFLFSRFRGDEVRVALRFANAAAALSTLGYGAQGSQPDQETVDAFLATHAKK